MPVSLRSRVLSAVVAAGVATSLALPATPAAARGDGTHRIVVRFPAPVPFRDAAPLVMNGDTPLGFGRVSADRRSVVLETRADVTSRDVRVVWSGGGVPAPRNAAPTAARPPATVGATAVPPAVRTAPAQQVPAGLPDPGLQGPLATVRAAYTFGDRALRVPTGYRVEVTGEVTYPRRLGAQRHPVVVLLHGRHSFCGRRDGQLDSRWPCARGYRAIPSQQGYRSLADVLASHGIVVVSVAANGVNAQDDRASDGGARDRGYLVMHHLRLWRGWATTVRTGPFGNRFRGKLDLTKVGLMGHSRGGEGMVSALAENRRAGNRFGIRAVLPLAPVNFSRFSLRGTPSLTVVPYCDGDVSDLEGVHFFDDATAPRVDRAPHGLLGVLGANHNFFNTVWTPGGWEAGTGDDWYAGTNRFCGANSGRLTAPQQVAAGTGYMAAFLRARLQGLTGYDGLFAGNTVPPASARPVATVASWSSAAGRRLLVDNLRSASSNALGGRTRAAGFDAALLCGGTSRYTTTCMAPRGPGDEPHLVPRVGQGPPGLAQLHLVWSRPGATWSGALPGRFRDVTSYRYVTVRVARDAWALSDAPPVLGLRLRDTTGREVTVRLDGPALTTPVFTDPHPDPNDYSSVPHALVTSVPLPLSAYHGVDLRHVASVTLVMFSGSGDMTVGDVSFQR